MDKQELEKRRSDPGRPKPPTPEQATKLEALRQQLKEGAIKFADFVNKAHEICAT